MWPILEHIEKLDLKTLEHEQKRTKDIRYKMIHELRILEENIRKLGAIEQLISNVILDKMEGVGEHKTKEEMPLNKIKKYEDMTFDELKAEMIKRGILD